MGTARRIAVLTLGIVSLAGAGAPAAEHPSATLTLESKSVAVGVGWSWGGGELTYKGKRHRFKIDGLSVIAVGASRVDATGDVYNLKRLEDFEGTYTSVEASGTAGGGAGIATMKNGAGVRITLHSRSQGIEAKASPQGVKITLER